MRETYEAPTGEQPTLDRAEGAATLAPERGRVRQTWQRLRHGTVREALLAAALAVATVAVLRVLVPVGIDSAAHAYQTLRFVHAGFQFWDNYWYDGRYSFIDYSLLYYPIAAILGQFTAMLATLGASGFLFARLITEKFEVRSPWPVRLFAISAAFCVWLSGEYPFALGLALGLASLALSGHRRLPLAALAALATLLASPLAFVLLLMSYGGIALGAGSVGRLLRLLLARVDLVIGLGLCVAVALGLQAEFPVTGTFHYNFWALFQVLAMSGIALAVSTDMSGVAPIRGLFAAMAIAALGAYVIPSPLGGNATRLVNYVGAPLIWLLLARRLQEQRISGGLAAGLGALTLAGQITPTLISAAIALGAPSAGAAFWKGAIRFLRAHANPSFRVEATDTAGHWDAYYLPAAGIPIVRGWFRQDDFPHNALLYRSRISPAEYRGWLRRNAVRYVVAARSPLDYSAESEARLLASGRSGLVPVYRNSTVTIYELPHATPLILAPPGRNASVIRRGHASLRLRVSGPGRYRLAVNYTPYWRAQPKRSACVSRAAKGFSYITAARAGIIKVRFEPTLRALLVGSPASCHIAGAATP